MRRPATKIILAAFALGAVCARGLFHIFEKAVIAGFDHQEVIAGFGKFEMRLDEVQVLPERSQRRGAFEVAPRLVLHLLRGVGRHRFFAEPTRAQVVP